MKTSSAISEADIPELAKLLSGVLSYHPVTEFRLKRVLFGKGGHEPSLVRVIRGADGRIESIVAAVVAGELDGRKKANLLVMALPRRHHGVAQTVVCAGTGWLRYDIEPGV